MARALEQRVRNPSNLEQAWRAVRAAGLASVSRDTRAAVQDFDLEPTRRLDRICRKLRAGQFRFTAPTGIPCQRPGKDPRPIVLAPVTDRIVQRAILQVVQSQRGVKEHVETSWSFGGRPGASVRQAIEKVVQEVQSGAGWYLKTDIEGFFRRISRPAALVRLQDLLPDSTLSDLLEEATRVELINADDLGALRTIFPTPEQGVAQGCSLSSLLGNVVLHDFDADMNAGAVACIRWVDDFIILGRSERDVMSAFRLARRLLNGLGMGVYAPGSAKAQSGSTNRFAFLGCSISNGFVHPTRQRRADLLEKVDDILRESVAAMKRSFHRARGSRRVSFSRTLAHVDAVVQAWVGAFAFCNGDQYWVAFDAEVQARLARYAASFWKHYGDSSALERQRLLGVAAAVDLPRDPIFGRS